MHAVVFNKGLALLYSCINSSLHLQLVSTIPTSTATERSVQIFSGRYSNVAICLNILRKVQQQRYLLFLCRSSNRAICLDIIKFVCTATETTVYTFLVGTETEPSALTFKIHAIGDTCYHFLGSLLPLTNNHL